MVKKNKIFLVCLSWAIIHFTALGIPDSLIMRGNEFYKNGQYDKAITAYKQVVDSGYSSSKLYYNLGNAYYKNHRIGMAILYYERAKLLAPNDEDIQHNLALVRQQVEDKLEKIPEFFVSKWFHTIIHSLSFNAWGVISIITFIFFLTLFILYLTSGRLKIKQYSFWTGLVMFIFSASTFLFAQQKYQNIMDSDRAVITSSSVTIVSSPDVNSKKLFVLHEGTKVSIMQCNENWCEIELPNGSKGWIKQEKMVEI